MISARPDAQAPSVRRFELRDWTALLLVVLLSGFVRLAFFTGPMGSDDVVYSARALSILHGEWRSDSNYVGALRYGVNLPMAGFMAIFGIGEFTANLWAFSCSLAEVAVLFVLAREIVGFRAALFASVVLALLPLHVNLSGRLLADTPLTLFVTLCFAFFYFAEKYRNRWLYLAAGLSLGAVYWVKESVAPLIVPLFIVYAVAVQTFRKDWLVAIFGALFMLLLNMALMWRIAGDPFQMFHAMSRAIEVGATWEDIQTSPGYYLYYLFLDIRHTWLMSFLAVGGLWLWWRRDPGRRGDAAYIGLWGFGLIAILSLAVVSLSPFRFIYKQPNYMLIFAAPLALMAGYGLATMKGPWLALVLVLLVCGSLLLSALEQQAVRVFTANSQAALVFAAAHPGVAVYGASQASALSVEASALDGRWPPLSAIHPLSQLGADSHSFVAAQAATNPEPMAYVLLDTETSNWGRGRLQITPETVPTCWNRKGVLEPQGFGIGKLVLAYLRGAAETLLPDRVSRRVLSATETLYRPRAAYIYEIPAGCKFEL